MSKTSRQRAHANFRTGQHIGHEPPKKGGIVMALLRSPLIGSGLQTKRSIEGGRPVDI
jgi:hypothetical protein